MDYTDEAHLTTEFIEPRRSKRRGIKDVTYERKGTVGKPRMSQASVLSMQ